jgi:hypothetical protein
LDRVPAKLATSTEDVLVDTRDNIYIADKQWGLFILRYTGEDEPKPTAKWETGTATALRPMADDDVRKRRSR